MDWGFDLTGFRDAKTFQDLLSRHGLKNHKLVVERGKSGSYDWVSGRHVWSTAGLQLITKNNPLTGVYGEGHENRSPEKGYASYIGITGDESKVLALVKDIKRTTHEIKDESKNTREFI